jgi:preprotein translocase subunit SecB
MQLSPLLLEGYFLKELHFAVNDNVDNHKSEFDNIEISVDVDTQAHQDDPLRWRCELTIKSKLDPKLYYPYAFVITYVGLFRVSEKFPSERVELLVQTNGPALLYSAAREMLTSLTGRGMFPVVLLPSVTFLSPPDNGKKPSSKQVKRLPGKVARKKKTAAKKR